MASPVKAEKATACRTIVPLPEKREPSILSIGAPKFVRGLLVLLDRVRTFYKGETWATARENFRMWACRKQTWKRRLDGKVDREEVDTMKQPITKIVVGLEPRRQAAHLPRWRFLRSYALCVMVATVLYGCATPSEDLWPPHPEQVAQTIYVSLDTLHAMIAFPADRPHPLRSVSLGYEEWGYAERAWYLEGKTGVTGVVRALFWPTEGVVEVGYHDEPWAHRTPQPPASLFTFSLSEEGYHRLRAHLRRTVARVDPIASTNGSTFYSASQSYHLFHTCHQYAAEALREAGLPVSPFWALGRSSLAWQLRRAGEMAEME